MLTTYLQLYAAVAHLMCLQDVAYALTTTLEEESLSKMDSLVDFYLSKLGKKLADKGINLNIAQMRVEYDKVDPKIAKCDGLLFTNPPIRCGWTMPG